MIVYNFNACTCSYDIVHVLVCIEITSFSYNTWPHVIILIGNNIITVYHNHCKKCGVIKFLHKGCMNTVKPLIVDPPREGHNYK